MSNKNNLRKFDIIQCQGTHRWQPKGNSIWCCTYTLTNPSTVCWTPSWSFSRLPMCTPKASRLSWLVAFGCFGFPVCIPRSPKRPPCLIPELLFKSTSLRVPVIMAALFFSVPRSWFLWILFIKLGFCFLVLFSLPSWDVSMRKTSLSNTTTSMKNDNTRCSALSTIQYRQSTAIMRPTVTIIGHKLLSLVLIF